MTVTRFSSFQATGRHTVAGVWLEDYLNGNRRLWVMDETMEASLSAGMVAGSSLFDAGPFHPGSGS